MLFVSMIMLQGVVWIGEHALQGLINFSWIVIVINLFILLPLGLFKKTGIVGGMGMYISSYVFGLTLWFLGLLLTYFTWACPWWCRCCASRNVGNAPQWRIFYSFSVNYIDPPYIWRENTWNLLGWSCRGKKGMQYPK